MRTLILKRSLHESMHSIKVMVNDFLRFSAHFSKNSHLTYFDTPYIIPKIWISTLSNKLRKLENKKKNCNCFASN